jgi:hypothetical protein
LYAVGQLGNSLLSVPTKQMSVAMVNADLAHEDSRRASPLPTATPTPRHPRHQKARTRRPRHAQTAPSRSQTASPTPASSPGTLLTSADGSAEAVCTASGAYLAYWSPQQGFEANNVVRGPAAVAKVTFSNGSSGIEMKVSCSGGVPVKHLVDVGWGGGHDE